MSGVSGKKKSEAKMQKLEFRTPKALWRPGMPTKSAVLRVPHAVRERKSKRTTNHKRNPDTRPADKERQRDHLAACALIVTGALPQDGGVRKQVGQPGYAKIALAMGKKCPETACRILNSEGDSLIGIIPTKGRNKFAWKIREKAQADRRYAPACFNPASAAELAADPEYAELFDGEDASEKNFSKFVAAIFDELSPLTATDRIVYSWLFDRGLFKLNAVGEWKSGSVMATQEEIGAELGMCCDAVRNALRRMADTWTDASGTAHAGMGLIKYVRKPGAWYDSKGNKLKQKTAAAVSYRPDEPNEYIGICDWVETEQERYDRAMESLRATRDAWAKVMDRVHAEVLGSYLRDGRKLDSKFYGECRGRMQADGVPEFQVDLAIPKV